jgi:L-threonylcarbamoyladenylate synthase
MIQTRVIGPDQVHQAIVALQHGAIVGMPTETVYGLAALAFDARSIASVFAAKERPPDDPLIVHVSPASLGGRSFSAGLEACGLLAPDSGVADRVDALGTAFWPGPLTLVLPRGRRVLDAVTAGMSAVAIRMPAHPVALAMLDGAGPLVAPSANRFGHISPTTAEHVRSELGGRIPIIVDGGPCDWGVESTVLRLDPDGATLLRPGVVPIDALERVLHAPIDRIGWTQTGPQPSPGLLDRHYAPRTPLRLVHTADDVTHAVAQTRGSIGWLVWEDLDRARALAPEATLLALAPDGQPATAARRLYLALRRLDEGGHALLLADPCPTDAGLGAAIQDRLRRASAARS